MKKVVPLMLLLSLALFTVGCKKADTAAPSSEPATPAAEPAAPANP